MFIFLQGHTNRRKAEIHEIVESAAASKNDQQSSSIKSGFRLCDDLPKERL